MKQGRPRKNPAEKIIVLSVGLERQVREKLEKYTDELDISASSYINALLKLQPEIQAIKLEK